MIENIGARIKEARTNRGYTQQQLADAIGKTRYLISKYESQQVVPSGRSIVAMAKFLNVDVDYLIGKESGAKTIDFYRDYFDKTTKSQILPIDIPKNSDYFSIKCPINCCNGVECGDLLVLRPTECPTSNETVLVEYLSTKLLIGFLWLNNGLKTLIIKNNEPPIDISDETEYKIVAEVVYSIKTFKGDKTC